MRLARKVTISVLALFIPPTVVAGLVLILLHRRGLLEEPGTLLMAGLAGLAVMVAYLAVVAMGLGRSLVRTVEELRHGAELIATVNPDHRLEVRTGDELQALGDEINRLGDRLRAAGAGPDTAPAPGALEPATWGGAQAARVTAPLDALTFVVLDTETTGIRPEAGDRVVWLAAVRVIGAEVRQHEVFDVLVDPGRPVPPESVRIHGIDNDVLVGAPTLEAVLPSFYEFVGNAVVVGHEVSFDLRFLAPVARRLGLPPLSARAVLDTGDLSRAVHRSATGHDLEALALRLGVPVISRHSALGDALTTAEILVRLLALLKNRGVSTLGEALEAARRARTPAL
ncbi:MAG TPA: exonuclease domain-containing protein [Methylomirabilota bacterium]